MPIHSSISSAAAAGAPQQQRRAIVIQRDAPQRHCIGRHLVNRKKNRNKMRVSGSDSYALLFLF